MNTLYFPGAFRPPHFGHFNTLVFYINHFKINKAVIVISSKNRDTISQEMSYKIWCIYSKYININVEIIKSNRHNLDSIEEHISLRNNNIIITKLDNIIKYKKRFQYNKNIIINAIKIQEIFRASLIRKNLTNIQYITGKLPEVLSKEDAQKVIFILNEGVI